jgi:hypothetical protein
LGRIVEQENIVRSIWDDNNKLFKGVDEDVFIK